MSICYESWLGERDRISHPIGVITRKPSAMVYKWEPCSLTKHQWTLLPHTGTPLAYRSVPK